MLYIEESAPDLPAVLPYYLSRTIFQIHTLYEEQDKDAHPRQHVLGQN